VCRVLRIDSQVSFDRHVGLFSHIYGCCLFSHSLQLVSFLEMEKRKWCGFSNTICLWWRSSVLDWVCGRLGERVCCLFFYSIILFYDVVLHVFRAAALLCVCVRLHTHTQICSLFLAFALSFSRTLSRALSLSPPPLPLLSLSLSFVLSLSHVLILSHTHTHQRRNKMRLHA